MDLVSDILANKYNYFGFMILMMIGLWAMIAKHNLAKKILGMSIFQSAIILFYVSIAVKEGASIPIIMYDKSAKHAESHVQNATDAVQGATHQVGDMAYAVTNATADAAGKAAQYAVNAADYINPLTHVLMLTAIVVSVATLGVALALAMKVYRTYNTLNEDEILAQIREQ